MVDSAIGLYRISATHRGDMELRIQIQPGAKVAEVAIVIGQACDLKHSCLTCLNARPVALTGCSADVTVIA